MYAWLVLAWPEGIKYELAPFVHRATDEIVRLDGGIEKTIFSSLLLQQ